MLDKNKKDYPDVIAKPPVIYGTALFLGWIMDFIIPTRFFPMLVRVLLGATFIIVGVALMVQAVKLFRKANTNIATDKPAYTFVKGGIYSITRNPMYISLSLIYIGIAIALDNLWILLLAAPVIYIINTWVVEIEEEYLQRKFGKEYTEYISLVPRWF